MAGGIAWSPEEIETLATHYPSHGANWDGWRDLLPGRTRGAITGRAYILGIKVDPDVVRRGRERAWAAARRASAAKSSHGTVQYALYKGDTLLSVGTAREIASQMGYKSTNTVYRYATPYYRERHGTRGMAAYRMEDDE